jgi:transposase-like protein
MAQYHDLCFNNKLYSGRRRYFAQYIEKYPIPDPNTSSSKRIIELVKELNELTASNQEVTQQEVLLNKLVEEAFGF